MRRSTTISTLLLLLFVAACGTKTPPSEQPQVPKNPTQNTASGSIPGAEDTEGKMELGGDGEGAGFTDVPTYTDPGVNINAQIAADFSAKEVKNVDEMAQAYGITITPKDRELLATQKFILKRLPETKIVPSPTSERGREFLGLYNAVAGSDAKSRTQANTLFWSADIFLHSYTLLEMELMKEMENTVFAPAMTSLSKTFYLAASDKLAHASGDTETEKWRKVRNYFAIPYALFSTAMSPLTDESYVNRDGVVLDAATVKSEFLAKDKLADTEEAAKAFIKKLALDSKSEKDILDDVHKIFEASGPEVPMIFKPEYDAYAKEKNVGFSVDFSQFTPRSHYTGTSLRRQYFRAMNWYIQVPFFVGSDKLTTYAFGISELMAEHPMELKNYSLLESTINFLVGTSDDLMPVDYLNALDTTKGKPDQAAAIREYLLTVKQPKIKSLKADYPSVGEVDSADVLAATTGMRFFSGKFIMDSYWTGYLTQGDEKPRPGYPAKLPPMASSLEVMALLGSDYARGKIPTLDFYTPENGKAIDKAMAELTEEVRAMEQQDWLKNAYTSALWTIRGLFEFVQAHRAELPRFMQGDAYAAKNLQTAAGFWSELRHAVLLYAKQSFAEKGGGGACDPRTVPEPPKAYIEPQPIMYKRLRYLAQRTLTGLKSLGFELKNFGPLEVYVDVMDQVIGFTDKELANTVLTETVVKHTDDDPNQPGGKCVWYEIKESDWETLRKTLIDRLDYALPFPTEGPVISAKDKRAAIVADVHTGGDSSFPTQILYEGTGVPYVMLTAVKDVNGPRLAIGFVYSQFETREGYGGKRMTDEQWQEKFYEGTDDNAAFIYKAPDSWPALNSWYKILFP